MTVDFLGERALILRGLPGPPHRCVRSILARLPVEAEDAVPSYETLGLFFASEEAAREASRALAGFGPVPEVGDHVRLHEIPVVYDGEDLPEVLDRLGLSHEAFAEAHGSAEYECAALGFCPGFAYLGPLPPELSGVPRRPGPRPRVPAGSVAITGRQTAVYPLERPGGWALVGRTPLVLVDTADRWFPIRAGDRVRFRAISAEAFDVLNGRRLA